MGFQHILGKHLAQFVSKFNIAATSDALLGFLRDVMAMIAEGRNITSATATGNRMVYVLKVGGQLVTIVTEAG